MDGTANSASANEGEPSCEEADNLLRSRKKVRKQAGDYTGNTSLQLREEGWIVDEEDLMVDDESGGKTSYKETLAPTAKGKGKGLDLEEDEAVTLEEVMNRVKVVKTPRGPDFYPSEEEKRRLRKPFQQSVIVKLLGRSVGYSYLSKKLLELWGRRGDVEVVDISHGYFLVKFHNEEDYEFSLTGGPWLVLDHVLVVMKWKPNFDPGKETIECITAWIRMPLMPGEYYDQYFLYLIGKEAGRVIKVDYMTLKQSRGKYAHVCVELDLTKPLMPCYFIEGKEHKLEYEGIHMICFHCGKFGHNMEFCEDRKKSQAAVETVNGEACMGPQTEGPQYGEWMTVQRHRRPRRAAVGDGNLSNGRRESSGNIGGNQGGSRFEILRDTRVMEEDRETTNELIRVPLRNVTTETRPKPMNQGKKTNPKLARPNTKGAKMVGHPKKQDESPMEVLDRAKQRLQSTSPQTQSSRCRDGYGTTKPSARGTRGDRYYCT